jgi:RNA polymerase sigma-70 factor (ECF subfamily)
MHATQDKHDTFDRFAALRADLHTWLTRKTGDASLADDVTQDALLSVWTHLDTYDPSQEPMAWLRRIAGRKLIDDRRAAGRERSRCGSLETMMDTASRHYDPADDSNNPASVVERRDLARAARAELDALPICLKSALGAMVYDGMTQRETAAALGVPMGTVKSRVNAAAARIRHALTA